MGADANIFSLVRPTAQAPDPLEQYGKLVSIKSMMGQQGVNDIQLEQAQRGLDQDKALQGLYSRDTMPTLQELIATGGQKGAAMAKVLTEQQQAAENLRKTKVETLKGQATQLRDIVARVNSDADKEWAKEQITQLEGPERAAAIFAKDPFFSQPFDPARKKQAIMTGDEHIKQLTPKFEKNGDRWVDTNPVTNPAIQNTRVGMSPAESANLRIKGAEATPGGTFSIPDIVNEAVRPSQPPAGRVSAASLLNGGGNALNATPQAPAAAPPAQPQAQPQAQPGAQPMPQNVVQAAMASGATGEELLKQLPKQLADQVKMMVEGRMAPPTSFAASKPYWQGMLSLAAQVEPGFDETLWKARQSTRTSFASGNEGRNLTKINTAIGHLDSFDKAAQALNNGDYPAFNKILNTVGPQVGATNLAGRVRTFDQAKEAVANELMSVFRGVGASSGDTAKWAETLNASDSPESLRMAVKGAVDLLESRIGALSEQYRKGMSTKNDIDVLHMVYPKARATLERLKGEGQAGQSAKAGPGGIKFLGFEE